MQHVGSRWFALASLLWCVSGPSGVLFTTAPIQRFGSKHCNLVSGSAALEHGRYRSHGSALTARVVAQLIEYQPPPGTETLMQEKVMSAASNGGSGDGTAIVVLAILVAIVSAILFFRMSSKESSEPAAIEPPRPAGAQTGSATTAATPTASVESASASSPAAQNRADEFKRGQRVQMLGELSTLGKEGTILGPARGITYAVQLDSGSIVHTAPTNFQHAAAPDTAPRQTPAESTAKSTSALASTAPAKPVQDPQFVPGQRVSILSPPKMAGKMGLIMERLGASTFAVQLESGSIFHFATKNIQDAVTSSPSSSSTSSSVPEFTPGQRVSVLSPAKMAGMMGSIVGPAGANSLAVQLESGSIINFATENIQDAAAGARIYLAGASPRPEDLQFAPGQRVILTQPPAMAGKHGSIVGPAEESSFAVQLTSGSIFHFATETLRDATQGRAY